MKHKQESSPVSLEETLKLFNKATAAEEYAKRITARLRQYISGKIEAAPLEDAMPISSCPAALLVSFKAISRTGALILSPEYYSTTAQARLVDSALRNCTASQILQKISKMVRTGTVVQERVRHPLNKSTIAVLREALQAATAQSAV